MANKDLHEKARAFFPDRIENSIERMELVSLATMEQFSAFTPLQNRASDQFQIIPQNIITRIMCENFFE